MSCVTCCTAEVVNISAGLGFNGYDEHGQPLFNLMENAEPLKVEVRCYGDLRCQIIAVLKKLDSVYVWL